MCTCIGVFRWAGGTWLTGGRRVRLSSAVRGKLLANRLVLALSPLLRAAKAAQRLRPIGRWMAGTYRHDQKSKRPLCNEPTGSCLGGIESFLQRHRPAFQLTDCSFKWPTFIERSYEDRRHILRAGDSCSATWVDDRPTSPSYGQPEEAHLLIEDIVEVHHKTEVRQ
jgi:hypothetical protein